MIKFKTNIPKAKLHTARMRAEIMKGIEEIEKKNLQALQQMTSTWDPPPVFKSKNSIAKSGHIETRVYTRDKRFIWTDQGTKPHIIRPKRAKMLVFASAFSPKTRPGRWAATAGSSGGPLVHTKVVHHPGTKPRHFTERVLKQYGPYYVRRMDRAMRMAAKMSGYGR